MNYQLHDYTIDSVVLDNDKIVFSFPDGFYVTDDHGHEVKPIRKKLAFQIDRGYCKDLSLESFIFIRRKCFWGWKYISFKKFISLFKKGNMIIYDEYDSKSTNWKMIQLNANSGWTNIDMLISDIKDIQCLAQNPTVHSMKLNPAPFAMIKQRQKTIELRLFDEKRQQIQIGDKIQFTNTETGETLFATVINLHRFDSFAQLYQALPLLKCGYTAEDIDTADPADMETYYSKEEQAKYGVVGIEICIE